MKYILASICLMLGTQAANATVQNEYRSSPGIQWGENNYSKELGINSPYNWNLSKSEIKPPKTHGEIYRFFHPKQERMWKGLHPDLRQKIEAIQAVMESEGFDLRPIEGYRSPERQATLLASASGVTGVGAWSSCHNYGLALDAAIFIDGEPSWNTNDPHVLAGYQRYGELAEMLGLNWGGRWTSPVDMPHVELKAECGKAKWAKRHGQELPEFIISFGPSSLSVLELQLHANSNVEIDVFANRTPYGLAGSNHWSWGQPVLACFRPTEFRGTDPYPHSEYLTFFNIAFSSTNTQSIWR
ncbi:M15 family metallopeptidase [Xanthomonas axonopodis]